MNNEEPQGGGVAVAESPSGEQAPVTPTTENVVDQANAVVAGAEAIGGPLPTPGITGEAPVTPTTENVVDQANAVVAGAEAIGGPLPTPGITGEAPVTPTTENVVDQANAVVAGAEAIGGSIPADGTPPPAVENSSTLNAANPFGTPGQEALNATHQAMVAGKEAAKSENKGGFLSKLKSWSPIKAKTESVTPTPAAPVEGGVGIMPGSTQIETPLPPGANQNLAGGTTPPVPNVTPEANAAVSAPEQPQTPTTATGTPEATPATPTVNPAEGMGNDINGQPITEAHLEEASAGPGMPQPDAHPEIAQFDKDKAAEGGAQDNAQNELNKQEAEQPDLLKVDQTEAKVEPTAPVASVDGAQPADIPSNLPDTTGSHIDGTASHPEAPVVGQESTLPTNVNAVVEPGDTPLEVQANELDKKDEDQSQKWTTPPASGANDVLSQANEVANNAGAQELADATPSNTETITNAGDNILSEAARVADSAGAQMLSGAPSPDAESITPEPTMNADTATSEEPITPTPTISATVSPTAPEPEVPASTEPTIPENVTSLPGVTPQVQTSEQIAASQSGTPLSAVGGETQPSFGQPVDATMGITGQPTSETDEANQGGNTGTGGTGTPPAQAA